MQILSYQRRAGIPELREILRQRRIEQRVEEARRKAERAEERRMMAEYLKSQRRAGRRREVQDYQDRIRARRYMAGLVESFDRGMSRGYIR